MKKNLLFVTLTIILLFTSCIITNDFSTLHRLALHSIANGSKEAALEYSSEILDIAKNYEEFSIAYMLRGYSYFINNNFSGALTEFETSIDYLFSQEASAGVILTLFMLRQYELINYQLDNLETFHDSWIITINSNKLTKSRLYEICALSNAIIKNKVVFDTLKAKVSPDKIQELEVFFFE